MKVTADTSVLVASFASWHAQHAAALEATAGLDAVVAHCILETYSVLTRLPAPHRMAPDIVSTYLRLAFGRRPVVTLPAGEHLALVETCTAHGLAGGAIYDALIAATCAHGKLKLLTLDTRARQTYAALGIEHELLA